MLLEDVQKHPAPFHKTGQLSTAVVAVIMSLSHSIPVPAHQ
jgi:hypothetical protein